MNMCVIGAGAWGTAFSLHLLRVGHGVTLVPRRPEQARALAASRENTDYLPGFSLPPELRIAAEPAAALGEAEVALLACPTQAMRAWCGRLHDVRAGAPRLRLVVSLAKGLELGTHLRPTGVVKTLLPADPVGALAGPTTAAEVARGQPAAMVLAAEALTPFMREVQSALSGPRLRLYTSEDLPGVEFGGCLKNIYAIAAGCCDGLRLGDNAKAAMITRALTEMVRVGTALGARPETFYGLSGAGDLIATCYGGWSRNRDFGQHIGEGRSAAELLAGRRTVVEGYQTAESFHGLCVERGVDAPILTEVYRILFEGRKPVDALPALMTRELKRE